jgi:hypothetical protein
MATGSGKTYTAVNFVYRLIKLAGARRVLFLVDRGNLGDQTLKEFQQFVTPDDGRKFTELYNVQLLRSNWIDPAARVVISTVQRRPSGAPATSWASASITSLQPVRFIAKCLAGSGRVTAYWHFPSPIG